MIKVRNLATVMAAGALMGLAGCSALGMGGGSENQQAMATPAPAPAATPAPQATPAPMSASELTPQMIRRVQADLKREGLYKGRVDGKWGPQSQSAVTQFQQNRGLQATGNLDEPTLQAMNITTDSGMSSNNGSMSSGTMGTGSETGTMGNMPPTGSNMSGTGMSNSTAGSMGTANTTGMQPKNP